MADTKYSQTDEYGFERPDHFDYESYGAFISQYLSVLTRRSKRWQSTRLTDLLQSRGKLKRFVRKGVPIALRTEVWMVTSGAKVTQQTSSAKYVALVAAIRVETIIDIIKIDLPRTFPDNIYFSSTGSLLPGQLFNVLAAFAHQNHDVGYCQGLNYIAGLLLLATKNEEATFWLLKALVENILPRYYVRSMSGLLMDLAVLDELVRVREPMLYRHLMDVGMSWVLTTTKWFVCIYAEVLPTETVLRIWDCLFMEGSKVLFRVALHLIALHRDQLLAARDLADVVTCFKEMGSSARVVNCHSFIKEMFNISLSSSTLQKLRDKHVNAK